MKIIKEFNYIKIMYIQSQNAEAVPPLGTILGNIGVNATKFSDEFNKYTINLPSYFIVKVKININDNKTFKFNILNLNLNYIINILKYKKTIKLSNSIIKEKEITCITLKNVITLILFKFPKQEFKKSFKILLGTLKSMNIIIVK